MTFEILMAYSDNESFINDISIIWLPVSSPTLLFIFNPLPLFFLSLSLACSDTFSGFFTLPRLLSEISTYLSDPPSDRSSFYIFILALGFLRYQSGYIELILFLIVFSFQRFLLSQIFIESKLLHFFFARSIYFFVDLNCFRSFLADISISLNISMKTHYVFV